MTRKRQSYLKIVLFVELRSKRGLQHWSLSWFDNSYIGCVIAIEQSSKSIRQRHFVWAAGSSSTLVQFSNLIAIQFMDHLVYRAFWRDANVNRPCVVFNFAFWGRLCVCFVFTVFAKDPETLAPHLIFLFCTGRGKHLFCESAWGNILIELLSIFQAFIQSMGTMGEVTDDFRTTSEAWMEQSQSSARLFERSRIKVLAGLCPKKPCSSDNYTVLSDQLVFTAWPVVRTEIFHGNIRNFRHEFHGFFCCLQTRFSNFL